jgi:hypothetical protein
MLVVSTTAAAPGSAPSDQGQRSSVHVFKRNHVAVRRTRFLVILPSFRRKCQLTGRNGAHSVEIGRVMVLHCTSNRHCQIRFPNVLFLHISLIVFY